MSGHWKQNYRTHAAQMLKYRTYNFEMSQALLMLFASKENKAIPYTVPLYTYANQQLTTIPFFYAQNTTTIAKLETVSGHWKQNYRTHAAQMLKYRNHYFSISSAYTSHIERKDNKEAPAVL
ncbi:hypothetical protein YYY_01750 [Anaplasma phagocytophilum str. Dog2]|nr:hypothetical protein WSQ_01735 [Anaplasma phagocytophilum str. JM]AGR81785.1 hypothetical protein YYY_01750 [Anaplasma phagocytophilum str. Dog2]KDB56710.1 hypothetical protein O997_01760 [Anaplasma phagocytophilum str. MRK]PLC10157.1 hypothetical protein C0V68_02610 [Anaplasma phagocytophilum]